MNDLLRQLITTIDRCLDEGENRFPKAVLLKFGGGNEKLLIDALKQWESEGKLEILKPLETADEGDEVIRMKSYIEGKSPWPNWPPND